MATTANATTHAALLKELYTLPPVRALNDKSFLHDKVTKESNITTDFSGKYVRFPVTLRRALGRGSRGDAGDLPINVEEIEQEATAYVKQHYYALEWSETIELSTKSKEGAFENFVSRKMKNIATDMAKELNRQWYNPTTGRLATCTTDDASGLTITVDSTKYIQVGDIVDIVAAADGTPISQGTARTVASKTATTVTIATGASAYGGGSGAVDVAGTEYVVLTGNYGNETAGLQAFADTGRTLHGINSSTYSEWDGNKKTLTGSPVIGESTIEQIDDLVGARGRGEVQVHLTTRGVRRRLADEFASQRRYLNEKAVDVHAGYRMVEVNGIDTVIDDDAPAGKFFALRLEALKLLQLTKPGFLETEAGNGAHISLKNGSTAGTKKSIWQAWYRYHVALACTDPGQVGMITGGADD